MLGLKPRTRRDGILFAMITGSILCDRRHYVMPRFSISLTGRLRATQRLNRDTISRHGHTRLRSAHVRRSREKATRTRISVQCVIVHAPPCLSIDRNIVHGVIPRSILHRLIRWYESVVIRVLIIHVSSVESRRRLRIAWLRTIHHVGWVVQLIVRTKRCRSSWIASIGLLLRLEIGWTKIRGRQWRTLSIEEGRVVASHITPILSFSTRTKRFLLRTSVSIVESSGTTQHIIGRIEKDIGTDMTKNELIFRKTVFTERNQAQSSSPVAIDSYWWSRQWIAKHCWWV